MEQNSYPAGHPPVQILLLLSYRKASCSSAGPSCPLAPGLAEQPGVWVLSREEARLGGCGDVSLGTQQGLAEPRLGPGAQVSIAF